MFPLHFQKELMTYIDESIAYMCDTPEAKYGYLPEDSHRWLLEKDLHGKALVKGSPPPMLRHQ
eukprot:462381-Amphidinium_carterae.1